MIDMGSLFTIGSALIKLGVDGYEVWQKASAAIDQATGKVDATAYAAMVAELDKLLADLQRAADEARA